LNISCDTSVPIIGEYIDCPLTVTKYGNIPFTYNATVDFGDGFAHILPISDTDAAANQQDFVTLFRHRYTQNGTYSIQFTISALNVNWTIEKDLKILGNKKLNFNIKRLSI